MVFSSSPVLYPHSSSPPTAIGQKRKSWQSCEPKEQSNKRRMLGGFILDDDDDDGDKRLNESSRENGEFGGLPPSLGDDLERHLPVPRRNSTALAQMNASTCGPSDPQLPRSDSCVQKEYVIPIKIGSGKIINIRRRPKPKPMSFEETIGRRSAAAAPGRAKTAYYGIDIHKLLDEHKRIQVQTEAARNRLKRSEPRVESIETTCSTDDPVNQHGKPKRYQMWTEKYRARKFTDLIGDEDTHRAVLRWLKAWDPVVFPGSSSAKSLSSSSFMKKHAQQRQRQEQKPRIFSSASSSKPRIYDDQMPQHRKILVLTGAPGLGKTTMAHVCARQVGYEVLEINASDERSREVVKGRIRDALGTENVRGIDVVKGGKKNRKAGRPVCVIVDEVDGVTGGSTGGGAGAGGEGGFMKALIDLVHVDQKNSQATKDTSPYAAKKTKKGDNFKLLRPLILVCNDLYAPALRPLRTSSCAEVIHVRTPPFERAIGRLREIFDKEGIASDGDAVRRLCQASWGSEHRRQGYQGHRGGAGEGDIRGVLVQAEWMARKLWSTTRHSKTPRLTKAWVEKNGFGADVDMAKGLSRGGLREIIDRIFIEGAGLANLPTTLSAEDTRLLAECQTTTTTKSSWGISELRKRAAISMIRESADTLGDHDRLMSDCFSSYPSHDYHDDSFLTKPAAAYDWLYFHDVLSSRVFGGQEWELNPYLSQGACAFHYLFAAVHQPWLGWDLDYPSIENEIKAHPFAGPRADFAAFEAEKANRAVLLEFQSSFAAPLARLYRSTQAVATELIPNVTRMLAPEVKPVMVGGNGGYGSVASVRKETEKNCLRIAGRVMSGLKITFDKVKIEIEGGGAHSHKGFALRMEPPLDSLATFDSVKVTGTSATGLSAPVRYAVRQVLDQEHRKEILRLQSENRLARGIGHKQSGGRDAVGAYSDDIDKDKENIGGLGSIKQAVAGSMMGKRDFFGRIINEVRSDSVRKGPQKAAFGAATEAEERVWVSFHEGFSNAVRKPITLKEFLETF